MPNTIKTHNMCHHLTDACLAIIPSLQHQTKISANHSQFDVIGINTKTSNILAKKTLIEMSANMAPSFT